MTKKDSIYFSRTFRTSSSEVWVIDFNHQKIGTIHLHFTKCIYGDVILIKKVTDNQLEYIVKSIDEWIVQTIEDREDFIFSVYQAKERNSYSDIVDHDMYPPTRKDIKDHGILLTKFLAKYQDTRGQLHEHVVKDYFKKLGFDSTKADSKLDALKVDIIAQDQEREIYCQVKLGKIDSRILHDVCKSISGIESKSNKRKIAAIVADNFPAKVETIKEELEKKYNLRVWTILKSQILAELPEYRRTV